MSLCPSERKPLQKRGFASKNDYLFRFKPPKVLCRLCRLVLWLSQLVVTVTLSLLFQLVKQIPGSANYRITLILRKPDKLFINTVTFLFYPTGQTWILQNGGLVLTAEKERRRETPTNNNCCQRYWVCILGLQKAKNNVTGKERKIWEERRESVWLKEGQRKIDVKWPREAIKGPLPSTTIPSSPRPGPLSLQLFRLLE